MNCPKGEKGWIRRDPGCPSLCRKARISLLQPQLLRHTGGPIPKIFLFHSAMMERCFPPLCKIASQREVLDDAV